MAIPGLAYRRRLIYLAGLVLVFLLYVFNTSYFSWLVFSLYLLLPVISILTTLPVLLNTALVLQADSEAHAPAGFVVSIRTASKLPAGPIRLRIRFTNLFSEEDYVSRVKLSPGDMANISFSNDVCGVIRVGVEKPLMTDLLGLVWLPLKKPAGIHVLLYPEPLPFQASLSTVFSKEGMGTYASMPVRTIGLRSSEVREYRPGDALRDIHWKLTARQGKPIARERESMAASPINIEIRWQGNARALSSLLGRLEGLLQELERQGHPYTVKWNQKEAETVDTFDTRLWELLSKPATDGVIASDTYPETANGTVLLVTPDAVFLLEDGAQKGVYP